MKQMKWDDETEVLVIGFGGAGAVAAITAHEAGARVLVVEKMEKGGGSTKVALGGFLCLQDLGKGLRYLESLCNRVTQTVEPEILRIYAEECMKNRDWFESQGVRTHVYGGAGFPELPDSETIEKRMIVGKGGPEETPFWNFLRSQVEKRQIPIWNRAPARDLVTDTSGAVIGAVIQREGKEFRVKAKRAVILTCGGFEFDERMKKNYLKGYPYFSLGSPGNTGDGIRMAQRVGADLWHMPAVSTPLGFKAPEFEAAFAVLFTSSFRWIYIDQVGKRFASEFVDHHAYNFLVDTFDIELLKYPRIPCLMILDEEACKAGPIANAAVGYNRGRYHWSKDNQEEVRRGWIMTHETLSGLAKIIGVDPAALEETVVQYNRSCERGEDPDYHRPKDKLAPIGPGPYYAIKLWPCLLNTQGGPRRNGKAQVLYPDGRPIPRLYSAGEMGSLYGLLYQGAGNLGECLAFGRIAGREAAKEVLPE